jgi:hypothetical protein
MMVSRRFYPLYCGGVCTYSCLAYFGTGPPITMVVCAASSKIVLRIAIV